MGPAAPSTKPILTLPLLTMHLPGALYFAVHVLSCPPSCPLVPVPLPIVTPLLAAQCLSSRAGSSAGTVDIWDVRTGTLTRRLRGHGDLISVMTLSPDGRTLATGSWNRSIKLWDAGTGRELRTLRGHTSWLYALAFSPDGNTLASSGVDGVLRLWEAPSAEAVALGEDAEKRILAAPGH